MAGTPLRNLRVFQKLCGRDALQKVYLTTTMWDEVDSSVGERRLDELKTDYWKAMTIHGAQTARCRSDDDSPKWIIRQILERGADGKVLLVQEEMTELKKTLRETEAGQELYSVRGSPQVAEEPPVMVHPPQTTAEQQPETDTELPLTARGSSGVSEEPLATVSIEDLEEEDIVIAYVI